MLSIKATAKKGKQKMVSARLGVACGGMTVGDFATTIAGAGIEAAGSSGTDPGLAAAGAPLA